MVAFTAWSKAQPSRVPAPPRTATILAEPAATGGWRVEGAQLAGAWRLSSDEPRFGGVSALTIDGGKFLALSDSGVTIRFPPPRGPVARLDARFADLGVGPCDARWKSCRDSEALAAAPGGGWLVGFENYHGIWRFDPALERGVELADLDDQGFPANLGIEGLAQADAAVIALPEGGGTLLAIDPLLGRVRREAVRGLGPGVSEAVTLPDGRILVVRRRFGLIGFATELLVLGQDQRGWTARRVARLSFGWRDNVEGAAVAPLANGAARLWLMTDNDFRAGVVTLLVAIDLPPAMGRP